MMITRVQLFSIPVGTQERARHFSVDEPWGRFAQFEDPDGNGMILQTAR